MPKGHELNEAGFRIDFITTKRSRVFYDTETIDIGSNTYAIEILDYRPVKQSVQRKKIIAPELLQPTDITSNDYILNVLNDDCLRAIMTQESIILDDLLELAKTCQRFHTVASDIFGCMIRKYPNFQHQLKHYPLSTIDEYFQSFGAQWETFDTTMFINSEIVLQFVLDYCTNIRHLKCAIIDERSMRTDFRPLFKQLHSLHFYECRVQLVGNENIFAMNENLPLQRLTFDRCYDIELPSLRMPHLIDLTIHTSIVRDNCSSIETGRSFFQKNPQLKRLVLKYPRGFDCIANGLQWLVNLEELSYIMYGSCPETCLVAFESLTKLRKIHLSTVVDEHSVIFRALLKCKAPLESLIIERFVFESADKEFKNVDVVSLIKEFKALTYLQINKNYTTYLGNQYKTISNADLLLIMEECTQLKAVRFDSQTLDLLTIKRIIEHDRNLTNASFTILATLLEKSTDNLTHAHLEAIAQVAVEQNVQVHIEILHIKKKISVSI